MNIYFYKNYNFSAKLCSMKLLHFFPKHMHMHIHICTKSWWKYNKAWVQIIWIVNLLAIKVIYICTLTVKIVEAAKRDSNIRLLAEYQKDWHEVDVFLDRVHVSEIFGTQTNIAAVVSRPDLFYRKRTLIFM